MHHSVGVIYCKFVLSVVLSKNIGRREWGLLLDLAQFLETCLLLAIMITLGKTLQ